MKKKRIALGLFALFWLFSGPFSSSSNALGPRIAELLEWNLISLATRKPAVKYLWGGYTDPSQGLDCSGLGHYALTKALEETGYKVGRVAARDMFLGIGGWRGISYFELRSRNHLDLTFLTSGRKPWIRDHVGYLYQNKDGSFDVIEASGSAGKVVKRPWAVSPFARWSDGFRHLTIGD